MKMKELTSFDEGKPLTRMQVRKEREKLRKNKVICWNCKFLKIHRFWADEKRICATCCINPDEIIFDAERNMTWKCCSKVILNETNEK